MFRSAPSWFQIALLLTAFFMLACMPYLHPTQRDLAQFESIGPNHFRFADASLGITLQVKPDLHFAWRFDNRAFTALEIFHHEAYFRVLGQNESYTLWGKVHDPAQRIPPISVKPGGFVTLEYPMLYSSALYPFRFESDEVCELFITAHWGFQKQHYRFRFPTQTKN